jgi:hypothetical protein
MTSLIVRLFWPGCFDPRRQQLSLFDFDQHVVGTYFVDRLVPRQTIRLRYRDVQDKSSQTNSNTRTIEEMPCPSGRPPLRPHRGLSRITSYHGGLQISRMRLRGRLMVTFAVEMPTREVAWLCETATSSLRLPIFSTCQLMSLF